MFSDWMHPVQISRALHHSTLKTTATLQTEYLEDWTTTNPKQGSIAVCFADSIPEKSKCVGKY